MRVVRRVSAARAVEEPVMVCLRSSCCHATEPEGWQGIWDLRSKVVMQNDGDFVVVILS